MGQAGARRDPKDNIFTEGPLAVVTHVLHETAVGRCPKGWKQGSCGCKLMARVTEAPTTRDAQTAGLSPSRALGSLRAVRCADSAWAGTAAPSRQGQGRQTNPKHAPVMLEPSTATTENAYHLVLSFLVRLRVRLVPWFDKQLADTGLKLVMGILHLRMERALEANYKTIVITPISQLIPSTEIPTQAVVKSLYNITTNHPHSPAARNTFIPT